MNAPQLVGLVLVSLGFVCVSCGPKEKAETSSTNYSSEYQVIEFMQDDPREWGGNVKTDFEKACGKMLEQGWVPAGGGAVVYTPDTGMKPYSYTQAFYR